MARALACLLLAAGPVALLFSSDVEDLKSPDEKTRYRTARSLSASNKVDPSLTPALVERLREDPAPAVRWAAAIALGKVQPTQKLALAALTEVLADSNEVIGVRRAAAESLGHLGKGSKRVERALEEAGADPGVTFYAVQALAAMGADKAARSFLDHRDEAVKSAARIAYLKSGGAEVLAVALASDDLQTRRQAASAIPSRIYSQSPLQQAEIAALVKAAADQDPEVRSYIAQGLTAARKTAHIIPALVDGLANDNETVRWSSAEGLSVAGIGVAKFLPELIAALDKASIERTKLGLILALGEAGPEAKPALPKLYALLKDRAPIIRRTAMQALAKAGAADPAEAIKQARALANDPDPDTRIAVAAVIAALGTTSTDIASQLKATDLTTALNVLATVGRLEPDAAARLVPDMLAIVSRIPPPPKGVAVPNHASKIADAIANVGPKALPAVLDGLKSTDPNVRKTCASALIKLRFDALSALPDLRKGLGHEDPAVRGGCAVALGGLGYRAREAIPDLIKAMAAHEDIAGAVGEALGWIGGVSGEDAKKLAELARAPAKPAVRFGRISALGSLGKDCEPIVAEIERGIAPNDRLPLSAVKEARFTADRDGIVAKTFAPLVSGSAAHPHENAFTLLKFELTADQKNKLVESLSAVLEKQPPTAQVEIIRALAWVGPEAAGSLPAIEKAANSPNELVRLAAKRAMKQIRP